MCDPATLTALTVAATVASAGGAVYSGVAQQQQATYQGQLADLNAQRQQAAARDALERGDLDAVKHGREVAALRGKQIAATAASGIELGFGTPLDIQTDTSMLAAEDNATIYQNAGREAEGFRINAANYQADAVGQRAKASALGVSTAINAGSTLIGGANQVAGGWAKYGKPKWAGG